MYPGGTSDREASIPYLADGQIKWVLRRLAKRGSICHLTKIQKHVRMEVKKITEGGNPMESSILRKAVKFLKGRKKYAVAMMSVLVVTAAGFETARPALTLEREVYCRML